MNLSMKQKQTQRLVVAEGEGEGRTESLESPDAEWYVYRRDKQEDPIA